MTKGSSKTTCASCFPFNVFIFRAMATAILSSGTSSRSTVAPLTRIQCRDIFLVAGRSAQAIGHPQTKIAISQPPGGRSVVNLQPGSSKFSISFTSPARSMCGLQPPQYFTPITCMYAKQRCRLYISRDCSFLDPGNFLSQFLLVFEIPLPRDHDPLRLG